MVTPTLAPGTFSFDTTVYIVLNDFGKLGSAYVETDEAEADESAIVNNIVRGAYSNPIRIVAFNTHEGWSRDVTEDIARKILVLNRRGTPLSAVARVCRARNRGKPQSTSVSSAAIPIFLALPAFALRPHD